MHVLRQIESILKTVTNVEGVLVFVPAFTRLSFRYSF